MASGSLRELCDASGTRVISLSYQIEINRRWAMSMRFVPSFAGVGERFCSIRPPILPLIPTLRSARRRIALAIGSGSHTSCSVLHEQLGQFAGAGATDGRTADDVAGGDSTPLACSRSRWIAPATPMSKAQHDTRRPTWLRLLLALSAGRSGRRLHRGRIGSKHFVSWAFPKPPRTPMHE